MSLDERIRESERRLALEWSEEALREHIQLMRRKEPDRPVKTSKTLDYEIPFDPSGGMLSYVDNWALRNRPGTVEMKQNTVHWDALHFDGFSRGCSSAKATFGNIDRHHREMFLTDLDHVIRNERITKGWFVGRFVFSKRGTNFGIRFFKPKTDKIIEEDVA